MYSSQEVGYIALQAPGLEHMLAQSEVTLVEVVDDDGSPTKPGETGKVVVTPLFNFATPLVRYALGDYAVVGDASPCGRSLPVLRQVLGRTRNMMVTRDGRRIWPTFGTTTITDIAPVRQHQFVQLDYETLEARFVVKRPLTPEEEAHLRHHILKRLPDGMKLNFVYRDRIERSAGGKFEDFVSMVAP
jgi:phenylacetate-CoA ligase